MVQQLKRRRVGDPVDVASPREYTKLFGHVETVNLSSGAAVAHAGGDREGRPGGNPECVTSYSCDIGSTGAFPNKRKAGASNFNHSSVVGSPSEAGLDRDGRSRSALEEDNFPSRPLEVTDDAQVVKKRDWLTQRSGEQISLRAPHDVLLQSNWPKWYPAAAHPGFVGDGKSVQYCRICGEKEDDTSSLICDSCDEMYHMGCHDPRLKKVPRVDDWFCLPCKRKKPKDGNSISDSEPGADSGCWWSNPSSIGKLDRFMLEMSNGRRMKVRVGIKFQAEVPDWTGNIEEPDASPTAVAFGSEAALTDEEKKCEKETAEWNLAHDIWPRGWIPARKLPPGCPENWVQCCQISYQEGDICADGCRADKDVICGKWRRAPIGVFPDDNWECSCALPWDPRHADCAVPQELPTPEVLQRLHHSKQFG